MRPRQPRGDVHPYPQTLQQGATAGDGIATYEPPVLQDDGSSIFPGFALAVLASALLMLALIVAVWPKEVLL